MRVNSGPKTGLFGFNLKPGSKLALAKTGVNGMLHFTQACLSERSSKGAKLCVHTPEGVRIDVIRLTAETPCAQLSLQFQTADSHCSMEVFDGELDLTGYCQSEVQQNVAVNGLESKVARRVESKVEVTSASAKTTPSSSSGASVGTTESTLKKDGSKTGMVFKNGRIMYVAPVGVGDASESKPTGKRKAQEAIAIEPPPKKVSDEFFVDGPRTGKHTPKIERAIVPAAGGLTYEVTKSVSASVPKASFGQKVKVRYDGRLASNGKRFDNGSISFRLGEGEVIEGWDVGIVGMKVGEKRKLLIPPKMAYGQDGMKPDIPPNATLSFDVELLKT